MGADTAFLLSAPEAQSAAPTVRSRADVEALRTALDQRLEAMRRERESYLRHWQDLSRYLQPRRGTFLVTPNKGQKGDPHTNSILNDSPTKASQVLASGMLAGMSSPARPWFRLARYGQSSIVTSGSRLWLDEAVKVLLRVFAASNFYTALAEWYDELANFGTAVMLILEDFEDVINCQTLTAGEYFLAVDHRNNVVSIYREFTQTVGQVVDRFDLANVSDAVKTLWENNQTETEVVVCHAIEPNDRRLPFALGPKAKPWRSVYWERGRPRSDILEWRGFDEFPAAVSRWSKKGNEPYGKGPSTNALADIKTLQLLEKRRAQVVDKMTAPAMVADAQLQQQGVSMLPGQTTYVANVGGVGVKPIYEPPPAAVTVIDQAIERVERRIDRSFYADLWMMMAELEGVQPRNDLEVTERRGEKLLQLGPVLESVERELNRIIERTFNILVRHSLPFWQQGQGGSLPVPPPDMQGMDFDIEYISMLSQAQKAMATTGIEGLMAFIGSVYSLYPQAADLVDIDEAVSEYGDILNAPARILRDPKQVAALRDARAKQQQQQQAMEQSMAAVQGAHTLSQIPVGQGQNALQKMMGGGM